MKQILKKWTAALLILSMMLGLFPPIEINLGDGLKFDLPDLDLGLDFSLPVSAAGSLTTTVPGLTATWTDASNSKGSASWSASGNTITGTATGYTQYIVSSKNITTKLTLTNNLGSEAKLEFNYSLANGGSVSGISGNKYEGTLANGASLTITLTSPKGAKTNTLTISGIKLTSTATGNVTNTFKPGSNGSYTVDGATITAATEVTKGASETYAVVATATSGYKFFGWYNETTGKYIYSTANTSLTLPTATTIYPVFIPENAALFGVGADQFFDLNAANTAAANGSTKTIILLNNGTLSAGNYTISSGVTLLIPCDDANTVLTTKPNVMEGYSTPSIYHTLTMAEGAHITVDGEISVGGSHSAEMQAGHNGCVSGPVGIIHMASGSTITVNSKAFLYAWGYITGSGSVTAESGATVYESFQVTDYRGGDVTSSVATDKEHAVFPMSQYYLQNIEVPLTLKSGAIEKAAMSVTVTLLGVQTSDITVIGTSDAMFMLSEGYIVKDFNESNGRLEFEIVGTVSVSTISMSMKVSLGSATNINTENFNLPIPGHMTVTAKSGSNITMAQDICLLPGSELYVENGATCTIAEGVRVIAYSWKDWTSQTAAAGGQAYFVHPSKHYKKLWYSPSTGGAVNTQGLEKDALICVDGIVDASVGAVYTTVNGANIYTNGTGKVITTPGTETSTYQLFQTGSDSKTKDFVKIDINPAALKNADGSYTETANAAGGTLTMKYTNGKWVCTSYIKDGDSTDHIHVWDNACDATCNVCSTTRTPADHVYDDACDAGCNVCGAERTPPHQFEDGWKYDGENHWHKCTCGATKDLTAHTYKNNCDTDCNVCGATREAPHTPNADDGDCTTEVTCSACGAVTTAKSDGHYDAKEDGDHKCDHTGCNYVFVGCTPGTPVEENRKDPTCTEPGSYEEVTYCIECGVELSRENKTIDALGHDGEDHAKQNATCLDKGYTAGVYCLRCKTWISGHEEIPALGHKDEDNDHVCDNGCDVPQGTHADGDDANHTCDYCQGAVEGDICVDSNKDHKCDECEAVLSECADSDDKDHKCDYCEKVIEECYDTVKDHKCDECEAVLSECADSDDPDHNCDWCGDKIEECYGGTATCTEDAVCVECGDHYIPALGHRFTDGSDTGCDFCNYTRFAYIGKDNYETLDEALTAAQEGDTIVVLKQIIIEGEVTWDLTGKTLDVQYVNEGDYALKVRGNLTIKGGNFRFANIYGIGVTSRGTLTIDGGKFTTPADYYLVGNWGATTINGGEFESVYCNVNAFDGTVTINGGKFTVTDTSTEWPPCDVFAEGQGVAIITGGNFSTDVTEHCIDGFHTVANAEGRFIAAEHNFSEIWTADGDNHWHECACGAISAWAGHSYDDDFDAKCNACEYEREAKTLIATIGGVKFDSLAAALAVAKDGDEIVLCADVTLTEKLIIETKQTWKFGEYTVKFANGDENYSLVIKGDLTIKSGKFVVGGWYGIGVTGALTVNGGEFTYEGYNDYLIGNWGTTTISGGAFEGQYCCVNNFGGTTTINGGTFKTAEKDATGEWDSCDLMADSGLAVKGGSFSKDVTEYCDEKHHTALKNGAYRYENCVGSRTERENEVVAQVGGTGSYETVVYCACGHELSRVKTETSITTNKFEDDNAIPDSIKDKIDSTAQGDNDVERLENLMVESVIKDKIEEAIQDNDFVDSDNLKDKMSSTLIDVSLQYVDENGEWQKADEEHFPASGKIEIILPIPDGTKLSTHTFFVAHMFTSDAFGEGAGHIEYPEEIIEFVGEDGKEYIKFVVTGLSPITLTAVETDPCADGHDCNEQNRTCKDCGEHVYGDVNGDNVVNTADVAYLNAYRNGKITLDEKVWRTYDANGDGTIDLDEIQVLFSYVMYPPVTASSGV